MADTVVEFINTTKTYSDFVTGVTLVSNGANEQAVVRDIALDNPGNRTFDYNVGNTTILSTNSSVITGTELLGASTSLVMKPANTVLANGLFTVPQSQSLYYKNSFSTIYNNVGTASIISDGNIQYTFSPTLTDTPNFVCFAANGDFYYSQGTSGNIYRRAGGVNGTQTTAVSGSTNNKPTFDGRYIFSFGNGVNTMNVYDTTTNTSTNGTISGYSGTTIDGTASTTSIDGYAIIKVTDGQSATTIIVNTNRVATGQINVGQQGDGIQGGFAVGKNSDGNYFLFRGDGGNILRVFYLGTSLATPVTSVTNIFNTSRAPGWLVNNQNANPYVVNPLVPRIIFGGPLSSTYNGYVDLDNWDVGANGTFSTFASSNFSSSYTWPMQLTTDIVKANTDFGIIDVRVTGIKTT